MIVNAMSVDSQMATGGTYTMANLPGGSLTTPLLVGYYGIEVLGWSPTSMPMSIFAYSAVVLPHVVDLRVGKDSAEMQMVSLW